LSLLTVMTICSMMIKEPVFGRLVQAEEGEVSG
jgi:hypothetical protein